jgi:carbon monoxide dehydrogenase subunit G
VISIRATVPMPGSADDTWALLTDWATHSRWIPATTVTVVEETGGVGTRFVGRTHLGPLGFDDPMTVTESLPPSGEEPGRCAIRKTGRVVVGTAGFTVTATGPTTSTVTWWEDVTVAPTGLTRWVEPLVARAGSRAFARVLRSAAADLDRR